MAHDAQNKYITIKGRDIQQYQAASARSRTYSLPPGIDKLVHYWKIAFLLTKRDLKTIVIPQTLFGVICALSGSALTTNSTPRIDFTLLQVPRIVLWNWINLFIFDLSNQRLPSAIKEDTINRSWRVLPSGLLTERQAKRLLLYAIPVVTLISLWLGAVEESIVLTALDWMYNDLGGAEETWILRNLNNALGYVFYGSASIRLASGFPRQQLNRSAVQWLAIVASIITFTMQVQDLADQEGDKAVGRKTAPLVLGDTRARWLSAVAMGLCSVVSCCFWKVHWGSWAFVLTLAMACDAHILLRRHAAADARSFSLWCCWLCSVYLLPILP